jgi:hypothetical protein
MTSTSGHSDCSASELAMEAFSRIGDTVTFVFDCGGWSAELFRTLRMYGYDFVTKRKPALPQVCPRRS